MKGKLEVESELGKGSTFLFYMPKVEAQEQRPELISSELITGTVSATLENTAESIGPVPGQKVLVVEDNPEMLKYVRDILSPFYKTLTACEWQRSAKYIRPTGAWY